jgi:hypothetical protein
VPFLGKSRTVFQNCTFREAAYSPDSQSAEFRRFIGAPLNFSIRQQEQGFQQNYLLFDKSQHPVWQSVASRFSATYAPADQSQEIR